MMEVKKSIVPQIMTILLVALMILMSEVFHEKEFIFPEITALTIGAWLAPKQVWKTNKIKLFFLIAAYASLGIILVKYVDIDIYFKILIGFVVCVTGLFLSKTTFAPLISATILPIIINSESWLYPLFATAMSILIVIGQQYLEKGGYRSVQEYHPVTAAVKETYSLNLKRLCALALTAFIALQLKLPFLIAPPLIVAFVELSSNHPKLRHNSIKLAFVTFICAFSGAYGRILISEIGDLPLTISAIIIVMTMLSIMKITKLYFPPAGALAILPLLIESGKLIVYPFVIIGGFVIFTVFAFIITKTPLNSLSK